MPQERIAQVPKKDRGAARLMVVDRSAGGFFEAGFGDLPRMLRRGDCLVLNDSRVSPCRLRGRIGGREVEVLIVHHKEISPDETEVDAMVYPGQQFKTGSRIFITPREAECTGEVISISEIGRILRLRSSVTPFGDLLHRFGSVPLPPYITNPAIPPDRYQTCFADPEGSAAAPTAGLHFTPEMFRRLAEADIRSAFLTLHVGPGTFRPITPKDIELGRLHSEPYALGGEAAEQIRQTRAAQGRVVAVGTTACRTLEHVHSKFGDIRSDHGATDLFIRAGHPFRAVDALLTNFHFPKTSLLMLVCAFAGREIVMEAYRDAIRRKFDFYSFGDAMLIL